MNKPTKTNLAHFDALTDDMIDTSDIPTLDDAFFRAAKWKLPHKTVVVTLEVESDVMEWFKAQGADYERYLSAALRIYAEAHQSIK